MKISDEHLAASKLSDIPPMKPDSFISWRRSPAILCPASSSPLLKPGGANGRTTSSTSSKARGQASWREYRGGWRLSSVFKDALSGQIDSENLSNRRRHSTDFIRTRLILLDFVLANQHHDYLETEQDKVAYFCETLGIPKTALPVKSYPGPSRRRFCAAVFRRQVPAVS